MAAKLVILAAAMAVMVVLTHATIQTTEMEEGWSNQMGRGRCRRQLRGQWPDQCEQYLMESMRYGPGRRYRRSMQVKEANQGSYFDECCQELSMIGDPDCQCEAMEMMMEEMRSKEGAEMSRSVMDMAMELPKMCGTALYRCRMSYMM